MTLAISLTSMQGWQLIATTKLLQQYPPSEQSRPLLLVSGLVYQYPMEPRTMYPRHINLFFLFTRSGSDRSTICQANSAGRVTRIALLTNLTILFFRYSGVSDELRKGRMLPLYSAHGRSP